MPRLPKLSKTTQHSNSVTRNGRHPALQWAELPVLPQVHRVRRQTSAHPVPQWSPQEWWAWPAPAAAAARPRRTWCLCAPGVEKKTPACAFLWRNLEVLLWESLKLFVFSSFIQTNKNQRSPEFAIQFSRIQFMQKHLVCQIHLFHSFHLKNGQQELRNTDVEKVGGKSASLGEMISQLSDVGVPVPGDASTRCVWIIFGVVLAEISTRLGAVWDHEVWIENISIVSGPVGHTWMIYMSFEHIFAVRGCFNSCDWPFAT